MQQLAEQSLDLASTLAHLGALLEVTVKRVAEVGLGAEHLRAPRLTTVGDKRHQALAIIHQGPESRPLSD